MSVEPKPQRLINAIGGTGTADDYPLAWVPLRWLHVFRIETANYSGTVDIQGRFREDDSWENVPYVSRAAATASYAAPSVAQISFSASTAVAFVATVEPREFLRLHVDPGGGNAGTITVDVIGTDDDAALSALWAGSTGVISGTVTVAGGDIDVTGRGINVAATSTPIAAGTGDEQGVVAAANLRLVGWATSETTGSAPATFTLHHGNDAGDPQLFRVTLATNESTREWFGDDGIAVPNGVFVNRVSGETEMTFFTKVVA